MGADLSPEDRLTLHRQLIARYHRVAIEYVTEALEGSALIDAPHHAAICSALDRVFLSVGDPARISRLLINIPPGFGKTLAAVWTFIARGLTVNPGARFIHTSYAADLALDNSTKVRDVLGSDAWRTICPITLRADIGAKGLWRTEQDGGIRAAQTGGAITGFRAGRLDTQAFSGAMVIDDPLKPDDGRSRKKTRDQNGRYSTTIASRLAHEGVPIIVIMQRLATFSSESDDPADAGDLSEFLLRGGSGEMWDHLILPAEVDNAAPYPAEWTHGRPIAHGLPDGPLWPYKLGEMDIARLKRANPYVWAAQYQQRPKLRAGESLIRGEWFARFAEPPPMVRIEVVADTASKRGEANDYSAFMAAGLGADGRLYILDVLRSKWTVPELHAVASDFWAKWRARGARSFSIEDAASGTYLIQALGQTLRHTVKGIRRTRDKFSRVSAIIEPISSARVCLPASAPWVSEFVAEVEEFSDDDSHAHDDQVDCLADMVEMMLLSAPSAVRFTNATGLR